MHLGLVCPGPDQKPHSGGFTHLDQVTPDRITFLITHFKICETVFSCEESEFTLANISFILQKHQPANQASHRRPDDVAAANGAEANSVSLVQNFVDFCEQQGE